MDNPKYLVTSTPHIRSSVSIDSVMKDVFVALLPATILGVYFFGIRALITVVLSVAAAVLAEYLYQKATKQTVTVNDFSAAVTGLLLSLNLPASVPVWLPIVGSFFAIIIVKQLFGGLGQNFINPALAARAFLLAAYPVQMTNFSEPVKNIFSADLVSAPTALTLLNEGEGLGVLTQSDYINALLGNIGGCIGETSAIALLLGAAYLLYKKVINWRIPVTFIGTMFVLNLVFGREAGSYPLYEMLLGGLILGAFFMATDYSTSPVTPKGQFVMGFGCGLIAWLIRVYGGYPEGVSYAILLMNLTVPLIDRFTKPRVFGVAKEVSK